ncbi:(2Fe-2S)-binding protein [Streptomyces bambusae]|uniref:(2Fe-2S)-binding protein n=1 Tax=Streptomyces bambusae TaxID=1550616 RepID=UPI0027E11F79|nr:(2Fe-2S)-binding protein [Streptomyces bambusae]
MREVLRELAAVGPFFDVPTGDTPPGGGFRPLTGLYADPLGAYVDEVGRRLGGADARVAASTAQLGIASRLWSLGLGCAALAGRVPDLAADRVWWRLPEAGPLELWLPEPAELQGELPEAAVPGPLPRPAVGPLAGALARTVLDRNLAELDAAASARFALSPRILRGNAASALVGALRVLLDRLPAPPHPPAPLVAELLGEGGPLAGSGAFVHEEGLGVAFVRRSCCLYYRAPAGGGGLCGDCVLRTRRP